MALAGSVAPKSPNLSWRHDIAIVDSFDSSWHRAFPATPLRPGSRFFGSAGTCICRLVEAHPPDEQIATKACATWIAVHWQLMSFTAALSTIDARLTRHDIAGYLAPCDSLSQDVSHKGDRSTGET